MKKKQEIKRYSAEWYILEDANLMKFLTGPGKIILEIPQEERIKYLSAGSTTIEFEEIFEKQKKTNTTSIDKIKQEIRNKQKYQRELKKSKEYIEKEITANLKVLMQIKDKVRVLNNTFKNFKIKLERTKFRKMNAELEMVQNKETHIREIYDKTRSRISEIERILRQLEKQIKFEKIREFDAIKVVETTTIHKKERERLLKESEEVSRTGSGLLDKISGLKKVISNKRIEIKKYGDSVKEEDHLRQEFLKFSKKQIELEKEMKSNSLKIKRVITTIKKLKDTQNKMQNLKIIE